MVIVHFAPADWAIYLVAKFENYKALKYSNCYPYQSLRSRLSQLIEIDEIQIQQLNFNRSEIDSFASDKNISVSTVVKWL